MKPAIVELLNLTKGMTFDQALSAIDDHYSNTCSVESIEWNEKMSDREKGDLIVALLKHSAQSDNS